jgi:hypothetical protein
VTRDPAATRGRALGCVAAIALALGAALGSGCARRVTPPDPARAHAVAELPSLFDADAARPRLLALVSPS